MKISDRTIERLALGELPDDEAQALIQQLERDDDHRLEEIIERDAAILETYPPGVAAQHIAERVRQHQRHTKPIEKPMLLKPAFKLSTIITLFLAASLVAVGYTYVNQPKKPAEEAVAAVFEPGQDVEFYEQLIRESKAKDDNYFQSLAAAARLTSDEKTAASHRARIINEFDPTSAIDKAPLAEALFLEAEPLVTSMVGHSLHFDDEETLRNALKNKTALAKKADDQMKRVIECGVPEWSAAAHYRMGKMYVDMADAIRGSFIPDRLTAEQRVTYHGVLETQAQKTEVQAIPAFRAAMAIGIRTPYVREAELELLKLERRDARPD